MNLEKLEASEPSPMKEKIKKLFIRWKDEDFWDNQVLAVWFYNKIPIYLWMVCNWRKELSINGWKWQNFLRLISRRTNDLILWVDGYLSWDSLVKRVKEDLKNPLVARYCRVEKLE